MINSTVLNANLELKSNYVCMFNSYVKLLANANVQFPLGPHYNGTYISDTSIYFNTNSYLRVPGSVVAVHWASEGKST